MGDDFSTLAASFRRELRIRNRTDSTIRAYMESVTRFAGWCRDQQLASVEQVNREHVRAWLELELGRVSAQTTTRHYSGVRQWLAWLAAEGEIVADPTTGIAQPAVPERLVEVPTVDNLRAVLRACSGRGFNERRDHALILTLADTGARCSELVGLRVADLDLDDGVALVAGKGRRPRGLPLGRKSVASLDRYLRVRARRKDAWREHLWLGLAGPVTSSGVRQILLRRSRQAGIQPALHPHALRHYFADGWLRSGGAEGDLMRITGWKSRQMLDRYAAALGASRARQAHRQHSPGDQL
jgi:site-specific recombinase XerD